MGNMLEVVGIGVLLHSLESYQIRKTLEVRAAVKAAAEDALAMAKALCPVSQDGSHGNPPGFLRAGNAIRELPELATICQWELYNPVEYCGYVVYGTYKMAAQDFMTPAMEYGGVRLYEYLTAIGAVL